MAFGKVKVLNSGAHGVRISLDKYVKQIGVLNGVICTILVL